MRIIEKTPYAKGTNITLVLANLVPVIGVLLGGWAVFDVLVFYFAETFIIGIFNVAKIFMASGTPKTANMTAKQRRQIEDFEKMGNSGCAIFGKVFMSGFFLVHYNFFIFVQFVILTTFFAEDAGHLLDNPADIPGFLMGSVPFFIPGLLSIIGSHAHSFYANWYKGKEYQRVHMGQQMFQPYTRIFIQQFVVIFGAILLLTFNTPTVFVLLLIGLKTAVDLGAHIFSHSRWKKEIPDEE